jgi:hypothetical protein
MTAARRSVTQAARYISLGPPTRWTHNRDFDVDPLGDDVLTLLPPQMAENIRQAKQRGAW